MRIAVYEHISSGGFAGQPIREGVLAEGFGMLRTITSDFKDAGHEITVLLDGRISKLNPPLPADRIVPIFNPQEVEKYFANIAKINDAVLIVAPETGYILQSLVKLVEKTGKVSLNCESRAISEVADKTNLYQVLEKNHLPTLKTITFRVESDLAELKRAIKSKLSYPVVFKPSDGVSCSGLSIVLEDTQVEKAIEKIKLESAKEHFVVQEFSEGEAASVSLLCAKGKAVAISLNQQKIKVGVVEDTSCYEGGSVPFNHPLKHEAFAVSEKVVGCFEGLRGYIGVDLILVEDSLFVIDVNPRLTTSYVGLSQVGTFNIAEALIVSILNSEFPVRPETKGFVCFSKLEVAKPTDSAYQNIAQINEVVSPPFPLNNNREAYGLIAGKGDSIEQAKIQLEEAKKHVLNIINRGK